MSDKDTVTAVEARSNMNDLLNRTQYRRERITITRHGKPAAVMVPVEDVEFFEALEDMLDQAEAEEALAESKEKGFVSWEQVKTELGLP